MDRVERVARAMVDAYCKHSPGPDNLSVCAADLEAARAAIAAADEWEPIETAPKSGLPCLFGWWQTGYWVVEKGHWANGPVDGHCDINGDLIELPATHWRPFPEPPESPDAQ